MNKVARMDPTERAQLFVETANRIDLPESLVEKDFWVCWVLKQLFSTKQFAGRLLFKGGTSSLSKVFGAIHRFSEDIDLAVDYAMLGFTGARDPKLEGLSKSKQSKLLEDMLKECQRYIAGEFLAALNHRCAEILRGDRALAIDAQDPNVVRFQYSPGVQQRVASSVKPHIAENQLAFTYHTAVVQQKTHWVAQRVRQMPLSARNGQCILADV